MNKTILERELQELYATHMIILPDESFKYIRNAMKSFAVKAVQEERQRKRKAMVEVLKHLPKLFFIGYWYFFKLRMRKWFYDMAVKQAYIETEIQNRKIWIVQSGDLTYSLISSKDFKHGKSIKVFKKELTFKDMDDAAVLTVQPNRK
jgi:hypothetical protein